MKNLDRADGFGMNAVIVFAKFAICVLVVGIIIQFVVGFAEAVWGRRYVQRWTVIILLHCMGRIICTTKSAFVQNVIAKGWKTMTTNLKEFMWQQCKPVFIGIGIAVLAVISIVVVMFVIKIVNNDRG